MNSIAITPYMQQATYYKQKNSQMVPFVIAGHIYLQFRLADK